VKLNDAVFGLLLTLVGAAVLVAIRGYPKIPGQPVGPALFPGLIAAGLCIAGLLLIARGLRHRGEQPWLAWDDWVRSPRHALALLVLRVRPVLALVIALVAALLVHTAFYKLLKVPLPWGLLTGVAW